MSSFIIEVVTRNFHIRRALLTLEEDGTDRETDRRTPDRYITLTVRCGQRNDGYRFTGEKTALL